jgi:hypothetical protein
MTVTSKELSEIVTANSLALAEHTKAMAEITRAQAENTRSIAQLTENSLLLHDSIKSLEVIARSHDAQIEELRESMRDLQKQWQAYLNTLPKG